MPPPPPPPPSWALSLSTPPPRPAKPSSTTPDPPGFSSSTSSTSSSSKSKPAPSPSRTANPSLLLKKSYEVALAPAKALPMTFITLYMSGSSLQIFSIMTVFMAFKNPLMGLLATGTAFERFETPETKGQLGMVKALYVLMQLVSLGLGIWKVNSMGLLPTTRSDWLAWEVARQPLERAIPAF